MNERFATDEKEVSDVVFEGDVDDITGFLKGDATALLGIEAVHRKAAKIAFGVADVGDSKLEIAGAAMIQHVPN